MKCATLEQKSGYTKTQPGLRPLCVFVPPHFFVARENAAHFLLIGQQKTSYTFYRYATVLHIPVGLEHEMCNT